MHTITIRPFAALKLLTFASLALVGGCHMPGVPGNGDITSETRTVTEFSAVEAGGMFDIQWSNGPAGAVVITDQNLLSRITTKVEHKTLRIDWDTQLRPTKGIKIKLTSAALTGVELNGAVRFAAAKLSGDTLSIEGNGATRIALDGTIANLTTSLNGASRLDAENLQTRSCEMSISGAGRADVTATETLKVAISGAGKVTYAGNPPTIEKNISGAGSIKRRE